MNKKITLYTLLGSMMVSSLALAPIAHAESYDSQIEETQKEIQNSEQTIQELTEDIRGLQSEKSSTEKELNSVTRSIEANEAKIEALVIQLEQSQKEMEQLQAELVVLNENIAKRNEQLEEQARTVQVDGDPANYIEFIIEADSLTDVVGRVDIVSSLVRANKSLVQEQKRDKEAVEVKEKRTQETITEQNATAAQLEEVANGLEQQRLEKEVLVAQLASETASAESEKEAHLAAKADAEARVANYLSLKAEAEEAARLAVEQRRQEEAAAAAEALAASQPATRAPEVEESTNTSSQSQAANSSSASSNVASSSSSSSNSSNNNSSNTSNSTSNNNSTPVASTRPSAPAATQPAAKPAAKPKKEEAKKPVPAPTGSSVSYGVSLASQGIPYKWGGNTTSGFDCSGFTTHVFRETRGINLPRTAAGQYASSTKVSSPAPGDLVFFSENGSRITHVGIYIGGGQYVGSQSSTGTAVTGVHGSYWGPRLVGYGRY